MDSSAGSGRVAGYSLKRRQSTQARRVPRTAFWIVALPWQLLGLIDRDQRLTALGEWVLPRALARARGGDFDREPGHGHG